MRRFRYKSLPNYYLGGDVIKASKGTRLASAEGFSNRDSRQFDRLSIRANNVGGSGYLGAKKQQKLASLRDAAVGVYGEEKIKTHEKELADKNAKNLGAFGNAKAMDTVLDATTIAHDITPSKVDTDETQQMVKKGIIKGLSMIPGYGTAIAAAVTAADAIGNATGTNLDVMRKDQANDANISSLGRITNNVMASLPGTFLGALTGNTKDAYNTRDVAELSDAFGGSASEIESANSMGGKSYLVGRRKINGFIDHTNSMVDQITQLNQTNSMRKKADMESYALQNERIYRGMNSAANRTYVGKNGMKLMSSSEAKRLLSLYKNGGEMNEIDSELQSLVGIMAGYISGDKSTIVGSEHMFDEAQHKNGYDYNERANDIALRTIEDPVQEIKLLCQAHSKNIQNKFKDNPQAMQAFIQMFQDFNPQTVYTAANYLNEALGGKLKMFQNGGTIGIDTNILPEGALHKNKNHLEDVNPEVGAEVTEKGIPVIVTDEEGNVEQVAEIEKEEIILRKELTVKVEELWKDGSEEAMIEAGRILAEEIITNTQDNTGQLEDGDSGNNN